MENWEILGVDTRAVVKFQDGKQVEGAKWYMVGDAPSSDGRYLGRVVREQFVSNERLKNLGVLPQPGQHVTLYFNRYGDICKVEVA